MRSKLAFAGYHTGSQRLEVRARKNCGQLPPAADQVDERKIVSWLCAHDEVPEQVVPFSWQSTGAAAGPGLGWKPVLRADAERKPYITDDGHGIEDCSCDEDISIQRWPRPYLTRRES